MAVARNGSPLVLALRPVSCRDVEERLRNSVLSGMIVGRVSTSAISDFPAAHGPLGLLAPSAHSKNAEILVLRQEATVSAKKVLAMFEVGCLVVILLSVTVRDGPIRLSLGRN